VGFTADVSSRELAELGRAKGVPVMEDLGSGCFVDLSRHGFPHEPTVPDVVASGVDLVSFSGDKLLGGPQAGIVVGRTDLVERLTKNPLNRALRIDKFTVAALEGTLYAYEAGTALETIPTLRMLTEPLASIRRRAQGLLRRLPPGTRTELGAQVTETRSQVGGGALPTVELPTAALALGTATRAAHELDEALRSGMPRVLGRVVDDRLLLDCRTILAGDIAALAERLAAIA
jgi:L-seryl-tRNA(Ser) seleniumtransferase